MVTTRADWQTAAKIKKDLYSDFRTDFATHPVTKQLIKLTDEQAIRRSLRNIILTMPTERLFSPKLGCSIYRMLFEPITAQTSEAIKNEILTTVNNFEPRAKIISVAVVPDFDNDLYRVNITYAIVNMKEPSNISITLNRVR